jgi:lysozyme family protein
MSFDIDIGRVLVIEGGYTPGLPGDPGGETNFGISKRSYPNVDIKNLTRDGAIAIYKSDFWDTVHADAMPAVLQYQALDFAVNSGIGTAIRKLQDAAGVADDGFWGPVTQAKVQAANPAALTASFMALTLAYKRKLSNWPTFCNGWVDRFIADLQDFAVDLLGAA